MHPLKTTLHSLQKQSAPLATPPKPSLGIPRAPIHHHSPLNHRLVFPVLHHHIRCPTPCQSATADPPTDALQLAEQYGLKIDLALTLAACAFEAYNTPINVDDAFVERTVSGTETTFLDKDYLLTHVQGVLIVHLQSATQLDAKDFLGKSDPYAVISVGPSAHRSATIPNTLDPEWDERFFLFVRDAEKQRLLIKVNDEDFVGEDDPLGSTMRGLGDVVDGEERVLDLELVGGGKGRIKLSIQYLPMTELLAQDASAARSPVPGAVPKLSSIPAPWSAYEQGALARSGANVEEDATPEQFTPVAYVDNPTLDTQMWVLVNRDTRHVCLAWRGTEQTKWQDILTDLALLPAAFSAERPGDAVQTDKLGQLMDRVKDAAGSVVQAAVMRKGATNATADAAAKFLQATQQVLEAVQSDEPMVHGGFQRAYDAVHVRVLALVEELTSEGDAPWTVYVTGHSLGGALATLSAYELATKRWQHGNPPRIIMYNFGSPRVGNIVFAKAYNEVVPDSWRIANSKDIVASVPRLMGYCHAGNCLQLGEDDIADVQPIDRYDVCTEIPGFSEGADLKDVAGLVADLLNKDDESRDKVIGEIVARETLIFESLVDGSGIQQHMEDFYMTALRSVVGQGGPQVGAEDEQAPPANDA